MADTGRNDNQKRSPEKWPNAAATRRYTVWTVLWVMIALALLTWIFAFSYGERQPQTGEPAAAGNLVPEAGTPAF